MRLVPSLASIAFTLTMVAPAVARAEGPGAAPAAPAAPVAPSARALREPLVLRADLDLTFSVTEATADGEQGALGLRLGFPIAPYLVIEGQMSSDTPSLFSRDTGASAWGGLRLHLPTRVAPYVFARAGHHTHDHYDSCGLFDRCDPNASYVTHDASIRELGGGVEARLGHLRAFVESGYGGEGLGVTLGLGAGF